MGIDALILKWTIQTIISEYKCSQNALKMLFGKTKFWIHAFQNSKADMAKRTVSKCKHLKCA